MNSRLERFGIWPYLLLGTFLGVLGLAAANHLVNTIWPFDISRIDLVREANLGSLRAPDVLAAANGEAIAAMLGSLLIAVTGFTLPLAFVLNRQMLKKRSQRKSARLGDTPQFLVPLRQAILAGIWVSFCAWLQFNRALSPSVATLLVLVFVIFEFLLQLRSRASGAQT